jgi:prolyl oligopeptidase
MNDPPAPRIDVIDILHGVAVPDPFRRLESDDDPETVAWVAAQNAETRRRLDSPLRDALAARLRELHRVPRTSVPAVRGDRVFFTEHDGVRAQAVLCLLGARGLGLGAGSTTVTQGSSSVPHDVSPTADGASAVAQGFSPAILVDPNQLDASGTTAITVFEPDGPGDRVVYGLSRDGSDVQELLVHDVEAGAALADRLQWVKFASIAWWGTGFFYTRYPAHEQYFCQVWYHRIGEMQSADRLIHHRPDAPAITFEVKVTSDDRYLVISGFEGASDHAEAHVIRLPAPAAAGFAASDPVVVQPLITGFAAGWHVVDGRGDQLYFRTDADAPFGKIVRIDLDAGTPRDRREHQVAQVVVPESRDTIVDAVVANGRMLVSSLRHASSRLASWSLDGTTEHEIALPGIGTINGIGARWTDARSFVAFTSFTMPPAIMACDGDVLTPIREPRLPFDPKAYVTEQVWYRSKDGTPISMFLVSAVAGPPPAAASKVAQGFAAIAGVKGGATHAGPPDAAPTGDPAQTVGPALAAPKGDATGACLLTGYGGFNISLTPSFAPSDFVWLDAGGTLAVANLRGGGEYGDAWHRAGMRERKQTVFDDFIAAAEWLESSGRAASGRVAIAGGSNGGLLVGACLVQRPDLFGAAICRVPVADMLRYHLFTVGRFWIPEYGCADEADDFAFLRRYSPYHNVIDGTAYPPTLVMTADTDDRVAPGMAKKFAARLQEASAGTRGGPVLLRVEARAGHGAGKPIGKQVDEHADLYAFLFHYLTEASASE